MKISNKFQLIISFGILIALIFIGYQQLLKNQNPKNEMDCLRLGSDQRAVACLKLLQKNEPITVIAPQVPKKDFPISFLSVENLTYQKKIMGGENFIKAQNHLSGTLVNSYDYAATDTVLRINFFTIENNSIPFRYIDFSPFDKAVIIPPKSKLSFDSEIRNYDIAGIIRESGGTYSVIPYSAKLASE
jgi:hypothetical protein